MKTTNNSNMIFKALEMIGTAVLYVCDPKALKPAVMTEEQKLQASAGRSFINSDNLNEDRLLRNNSESDLTATS